MTEITIHRNDNGEPRGLTVHGHSGADKKGNDIVCASISTIFEVLIAAVSGLPETAVDYSSEPDKPLRHLVIDQNRLRNKEWLTVSGVLKAVCVVARRLAKNYPEHCRVTES
ncbi:MAG: ribosomal-processing cysteine protease Prp [bacterium]